MATQLTIPGTGVTPSTYCLRCRRRLVDPISRARGYGPKCWSRMTPLKVEPEPEPVRTTFEPDWEAIHGRTQFTGGSKQHILELIVTEIRAQEQRAGMVLVDSDTLLRVLNAGTAMMQTTYPHLAEEWDNATLAFEPYLAATGQLED